MFAYVPVRAKKTTTMNRTVPGDLVPLSDGRGAGTGCLEDMDADELDAVANASAAAAAVVDEEGVADEDVSRLSRL